jgi:hypothetical protein
MNTTSREDCKQACSSLPSSTGSVFELLFVTSADLFGHFQPHSLHIPAIRKTANSMHQPLLTPVLSAPADLVHPHSQLSSRNIQCDQQHHR